MFIKCDAGVAKLFQITLLVAVSLSGCALQPPQPTFSGPEAASPGAARLYILRPCFTKVCGQAPAVLVDGVESMRLKPRQYSSLEVQPGEHTISIVPGTFDSQAWNNEFRIETSAGKVHYLAIWLDAEESQTVGVVGGVMPVPLLVPQTVSRFKAIRHELIKESDAITALQEMRRFEP